MGMTLYRGRSRNSSSWGSGMFKLTSKKKTEIKTWGGGGQIDKTSRKNKKLRGLIPYPLYDLFLASHKAISINIALSSITIFYITFKQKVVLFSLSSHLYFNGAPLWGTGIFYLIGNFFQWKGMMTDSSVQQNPSTLFLFRPILTNRSRGLI